jgi:hypothetical protein
MDRSTSPHPDFDEPLALPDFEDRLLEELRASHQSRAAGRVDGPGRGLRGRGPRRAREPRESRRDPSGRRAARRSLTAGALVAAAAAVTLAVVAVLGGGRSAERPTRPDVSSTSVETRTIAAIDEAVASSVVHVVQEGGGTTSESWYDEATGAHRDLARSGGNPALDSGPAVAPRPDDPAPDLPELGNGMGPGEPSWPRETIRQVDHCFREYADVQLPIVPAHSEASRIRDGLADGRLVADGTEVVDGRELIRVVDAPHAPTTVPATSSTGAGGLPVTIPGDVPVPDDGSVTYVDPDTHRPVLVVNPTLGYTQTIEYLPRTEDTLASLVPAVPEGFREVDDTAGDRERLDAGCL